MDWVQAGTDRAVEAAAREVLGLDPTFEPDPVVGDELLVVKYEHPEGRRRDVKFTPSDLAVVTNVAAKPDDVWFAVVAEEIDDALPTLTVEDIQWVWEPEPEARVVSGCDPYHMGFDKWQVEFRGSMEWRMRWSLVGPVFGAFTSQQSLIDLPPGVDVREKPWRGY